MEGRFEITVSNADGGEELVRTLTTLFSTRAGSQPADREFGISWECLDEIPEVAESLFFLEAVKKVGRYEPRAEVSDVTYSYDGGEIRPHIYLTGREAQ